MSGKSWIVLVSMGWASGAMAQTKPSVTTQAPATQAVVCEACDADARPASAPTTQPFLVPASNTLPRDTTALNWAQRIYEQLRDLDAKGLPSLPAGPDPIDPIDHFFDASRIEKIHSVKAQAWIGDPRDLKPPMLSAAATSPSGQERPTTSAPTTTPTTRPAVDLQSLIHQLGDDDSKMRAAAAREIKNVGEPAIAALRAASKDEDPQIRTAALGLITEIQEKTRPALSANDNGEIVLRQGNIGNGIIRIAPGGRLHINGGAQVSVSITNNNGVVVRDVSTNGNGRTVKLHEDANGISMEIAENGEAKTYKAKNAGELKEKEPEAYKLYEKYTLLGGGAVRVEMNVPGR